MDHSIAFVDVDTRVPIQPKSVTMAYKYKKAMGQEMKNFSLAEGNMWWDSIEDKLHQVTAAHVPS